MRSLLTLLWVTRRTGRRGLLVLAVLIGLAGGAVLTGIEATRRTDTAFDRLLADTRSWDLLVNPDFGTESALELDDVAALPDVEEASRVDGILLSSREISDAAELDQSPTALVSDGLGGYGFGRPLVTEGRMPAPDAGDEIFVSAAAAEYLDLDVGDRYEAKLLGFEDFGVFEAAESPEEIVEGHNAPSTGTPVELTVVGIGPLFDELVVDEGFGGGTLLLPPGFYDANPDALAIYWGAMVRLRPGADPERFQAQVEALVPDEPIAFQAQASVEEQFDRAVDPQVRALQVFTAVAALVALVIVGQAIARRVRQDGASLHALGALGVTRGQRAALSVVRVSLAAVLGAAIAVGIAILASPVGPVGVAQQAEPDPGIRIDLPVLLLGAVAVAVVFTVVAVIPAVAALRQGADPSRAGAASRAAAWGVAPAPAAGLRFAFDRSSSGAPTRSTLVGTVTGVALVTATLAFASSLSHFVETPRLYGTSWNGNLTLEGSDDAQPEEFEALVTQLEDREDVDAFGLLYPGRLQLEGETVPAVAIEPSAEPVVPTILEGRPPAGGGEVALGARTLAALDLEVGDTVEVSRRERTDELTVVGSVVLPAIGAYSGSDKTTLGEGALASLDLLRDWGPEFDPYGVVVRTSGGLTADALADEIELPPPSYAIGVEPSVPSDVVSLDQVQSTPVALTALLAGLIALTVIHALVAAVRARRRELAVLRTLGLTRRQVLEAVGVQALCIAVVGLVIGIPLGVAVGRVAWTELAERRGAAVELVTPILQLAGLGVAVLALALLVGLLPGLRAARAHPATILRTE